MGDTFGVRVKAELIRSLYRQGTVTIVGNWVVACVLVFLLWGSSPHGAVLTWFAAFTLILLARFSQVFLFFKRNPADDELPRWAVASAAGTWVVGTAWATATVLFLNVTEPVNVIGMTIIMMGLSAGSIVTLAPYPPSFYGIVLPTLGALIVVLPWRGGTFGAAIAVLAGVALMACVLSGRSMHRLLRRSLTLGYENLELRREAEEKTKLLETTLQNMSQGISLVDSNGRLKLWNQRLFDLLGVSGRGVAEGTDLQGLLLAARRPVELGAAARSEYTRDDGGVLEISRSAMPDGGTVITCTDISDLKRRESALESARLLAEQANSAKTRFLAAASHDLRQPIHALGLLFGILEERVRGKDTDDLLDQVGEAIEAVDSMLNSLLDISKLDAGVVQPTLDSVSTSALLKRLAAEYDPVARERGIQLRVRPGDFVVRSDPAMLARILGNLIANALRHTVDSRVLVAARKRGAMVRFEVYDTGPGIPEDKLDQIFVEFQQLGNPERDRRLGLGLGLAIVRRLADILDHPLEVRSAVGRGSCFRVTVPPASETARGQRLTDRTTTAPHGELRGRVVLVLDDDSAVLRAMDALLKRWGCEVITASSTQEAREKLINGWRKPDLYIVDYRLRHHESGLDAVKRMREVTGEDAPVLVITGDTAPDRLREARNSGYPLLHKPVNTETLYATILDLAADKVAHDDGRRTPR